MWTKPLTTEEKGILLFHLTYSVGAWVLLHFLAN